VIALSGQRVARKSRDERATHIKWLGGHLAGARRASPPHADAVTVMLTKLTKNRTTPSITQTHLCPVTELLISAAIHFALASIKAVALYVRPG